MAGISTIVNELKTIGEAFSLISQVSYERVSGVNIQSKEFPLLLIDSVHQTTRGGINDSFLPKHKKFQFNIYVFDTYNYNERNTTELEEKQQIVDNILEQYVAEVLRRSFNESTDLYIDNKEQMTGFIAVDVHNAKLVQSSYRLDITVFSDCQTGTFNY